MYNLGNAEVWYYEVNIEGPDMIEAESAIAIDPLSDGMIHMAYTSGPPDVEPTTLSYRVSQDNGMSWSIPMVRIWLRIRAPSSASPQ